MRHPRSIFDFNTYHRERFVAETAASLPAGTRVLDAGAGPCTYRPMFAHCEYRAQDFAAYAGSDHAYGVLDYISDITAIPVADDSFDVVLCTEVLEHLPDPEAALREFARILRLDGRMYLTAPLGSGLHMEPFHFFGGFTPHWYERVALRLRLNVEACRPNHGFFKMFGQESQRFVSRMRPRSLTTRVLLFPLELVFHAFFGVTVPLLCHVLDRFERPAEFTVGYFVVMRKSGTTEHSA